MLLPLTRRLLWQNYCVVFLFFFPENKHVQMSRLLERTAKLRDFYCNQLYSLTRDWVIYELRVASCELRVENCELMHFASCILRVENI